MSRSPQLPDRGPARLSAAALLGYSFPALPLAALTLPVYIYLPTFYAEHLGLGLAAVGVALLVARVWDVVTDPLIGLLSDRSSARFGRRPLVALGTPLVMAATWFLFVPPAGAGATYLLLWSVLLYLGWTSMILPLHALGAELSPDYHERSRITAFREVSVLLGTLLALGLPAAIGLDDVAQAGEALSAMATAVLLLLPLGVAALLALTPERPAQGQRRLSPRQSWTILLGNRPFRRLLAAYLFNGIANGLPATLFLLFVQHGLERPDVAGLLLIIYFGAGIAATPLWLRLSRRFGKHRVWSAAMVWACLVFIWVPFLGPGDVGWFVAVCVLTGVSLGADLVLPPSMQADVIDLDTAESGNRRAGLFFALWGMTTKLALAAAVGLAFPLLDLAGFRADAVNDGDALFALAALYSLAPVIFKAAAIVLIWGFPITAERQAEVRSRIAGGEAEQA